MLYNFLKFFFPYAGIIFGIGIVLLIVANILYTKDIYEKPKRKKVFNIIFGLGEILYIIGIIFSVSTLPVQDGTISEIISSTIILGILIIFITLLLHVLIFYTVDSNFSCIIIMIMIIQLVLSLIASIIFSILLYPDYKITEVKEDNVVISQESRQLTTFNDIPLTNVSGHFSFGYGDISTSDYLTYWYIDEHNNVIYDKALAYDSIKRPQEDGNYNVTITTYATVTKSSTIHRTFDDKYSNEHTVAVFYLPPELVGTLNNN